MKVLHITNWYHTLKEPHKVPFVREHFEALNLFTEGFLVHAEVVEARGALISFKKTTLSEKEISYTIGIRLNKWFLKEILSSILFVFICIKHRSRSFDVVNVHTGYPLLTWCFVHWFCRRPLLMVEHWTAFHYNFNLPKDTNKLDRIKRIYKRGTRLLTVSKRLALDIEEFAGVKQDYRVLPNVVDSKVFSFSENIERQADVYFMVNHWRRIKSPMEVFEGFKDYLEMNPTAKLRVGGYGEMWPEMEQFVEREKLQGHIFLLGTLSKPEIAYEMQRATALLHAADYETFSVVCAEAISCGCPVMVTRLDAVAEFIHHGINGYLKDKDETWLNAIMTFRKMNFSSKTIAKDANAKFSKETIGELYYGYNEELCLEQK